MKVIYEIGKIKTVIRNAVLVIGVFDGIHIGHQELIRKAIKRAQKIKGKAMVMTFHPHPIHVLHPEKYAPLISSLSHRLYLFKELGVSACIVVKFTKQFAKLTPRHFIKKYLTQCMKLKEVFVGDDFRFGQNRLGTLDLFKEEGAKYGFKVNNVHPILEKGSKHHKVSSSHIRKLITTGRLKIVEKYLGRPFSILGTVVKGDQRGATIGYPTANIVPKNEVLPPLGVYAVRIYWKKKVYQGMANLGERPSFKRKNPFINVEVYIFDFKRSIYGEDITIEFVKKVRKEKKFASIDALKRQLSKDEKTIRNYFFA